MKYLVAAGIVISLSAFAQTNSQTIVVEHMSHTPTFKGERNQPERAGG